jgi:small-conductance mechanosensitive channel
LSSGVLPDPEPFVLIDSLDASTVSIKVFGWVDQQTSDFGKVRSEAIRAVKSAFDDEDISMPAPIQNIRAIDEASIERPWKAPRTSAETDHVSDTAADRTIDRKVDAARSDAETDLLTTAAPRE